MHLLVMSLSVGPSPTEFLFDFPDREPTLRIAPERDRLVGEAASVVLRRNDDEARTVRNNGIRHPSGPDLQSAAKSVWGLGEKLLARPGSHSFSYRPSFQLLELAPVSRLLPPNAERPQRLATLVESATELGAQSPMCERRLIDSVEPRGPGMPHLLLKREWLLTNEQLMTNGLLATAPRELFE